MLMNSDNKTLARSRSLAAKQALPRLSLSLHTMPQTADSHFKKWLFLGLLIFGLMVLIAFLIFWQ
ncbi:MAG: hypothetical protein WC453_01480 [Patescibacteria group bacterium]